MITVYPAQIDTAQNLPLVTDNFTPVRATVVNGLRGAILAIEQTLGINPAGSYGTVVSRLSTLENSLANTQVISLHQDLGGTLTNPLVIGLRGNPIATTSPTLGQFLGWNGIAWIPTTMAGATVFGGDISGATGSQTVIGLRGYSVSATPPTNQEALVYNGTTYVPVGIQTVFNVKSYGAKGDGSTDDAVAIKATISAAVSAIGGGVYPCTIYFPQGMYQCSQELDIPVQFNVKVRLARARNSS